jgi:tetratricopeptide (TPR) repeat protein/TolB-like protein
VLEQLGERAVQQGDRQAAVSWWRRVSEQDPYSTRVALRVMEALEAAGDRAGALQHAARHTARLRAELDAEPAPDVAAYVDRLRAHPERQASLRTQAEPSVGATERLERFTAAIASRYTIRRELGAGGMATVYLAEDRKHERKVALKVLRPELAAVLGAERFLHEIKVTANLQHPHILPLHDSGAAEGFLYYVMPYVAGESLREKLTRDTQLGVEAAVQIAQGVATALDYAHRQGVIHRDIKPENILLHEGQALVADFGIALAVTAAGGTRLTGTGLSPGTPAYMSPEQAAGDPAVEARSDVYALGCVVYEMLAGEPPFTGPTAQAILARQALDPVPNLRTIRTTVPEGAVQAVERALAKVPADRFATAAEFSDRFATAAEFSVALTTPVAGPVRAKPAEPRRRRRLAVFTVVAATVLVLGVGGLLWLRPLTGSALVRNRVVVAPFENRTGDASLDQIGRIAADWVTNGLTLMGLAEVVSTLEVVAALSVAEEAGTPGVNRRPGDVLVEETRARILVSGSYHVRGDELEFQAQLVDMTEGAVLAASEPVRGSRDDPMGAIDRLQVQVMGAVAAHFDPQFETGSGGSPPNFEAYQAFMDAGDHSVRFEWREAEDDLRGAIALDSTFVQAYLILAIALENQREWSVQDSVVQVIERKFERLGPLDRAQLQQLQGHLSGDRAMAMAGARRAAELSPGMSRFQAAFTAVMSNRPREAIQFLESMDPDRGFVRRWKPYWLFLAAAHHQLGEYAKELRVYERARERFPDEWGWTESEMPGLAARGRVRDVEERLGRALEQGFVGSAVLAARSLRAFGHRDAAARAARRVVEYFESHDSTHAVWGPNDQGGRAPGLRADLAEALSLLGRFEEAQPIYDELAQQFPGYVEAHGLLGVVAARRGDTKEASRIAKELEGLERPYLWGKHLAWSARIAAAQGDAQRAVRLLQQALSQGLRHHPGAERSDHGVWPSTEWVFESIRDDAAFQELMRPKG